MKVTQYPIDLSKYNKITKSSISSEIELKEFKEENNLNLDKENENKYIKDIFQNLTETEKRDQALFELTKLKETYKNLPICIFYSSTTMTIL